MLRSRFGERVRAVVPYQVQSVLDGVWSAVLTMRNHVVDAIGYMGVVGNPDCAKQAIERDPQEVFLLGRQYEQRVDASALRADEGRGIAAISVGEPRAGIDPTISEWGNPIVQRRSPYLLVRRAPGELKHLMYPEEEKVFP